MDISEITSKNDAIEFLVEGVINVAETFSIRDKKLAREIIFYRVRRDFVRRVWKIDTVPYDNVVRSYLGLSGLPAEGLTTSGVTN